MCYCYDAPDNCPRAGTRDLFPCVGSPIVISLPHFYKADPELLAKIESGLNPNEKDHGIYIHFESVRFIQKLKFCVLSKFQLFFL